MSEKLISKIIIEQYIKEFKISERAKEAALEKLFLQYPENKDLSDVVIKITTLNSLYSTRLNNNRDNRKKDINDRKNKTIIDVVSLAEHIIKNKELDDWMMSNDEEQRKKAFNYIALKDNFELPQFKKCPSFASKYCSWHNKNGYPIMDSITRKALYKINKSQESVFSFKEIKTISSLDDYNIYYKASRCFRDYVNETFLKKYTFKEIDMFLWKYGKEEG